MSSLSCYRVLPKAYEMECCVQLATGILEALAVLHRLGGQHGPNRETPVVSEIAYCSLLQTGAGNCYFPSSECVLVD